MGVHVVISGIKNADGNIGTMIGGPFKIGQQIGPDEARLYTTLILLQAGNMTIP